MKAKSGSIGQCWACRMQISIPLYAVTPDWCFMSYRPVALHGCVAAPHLQNNNILTPGPGPGWEQLFNWLTGFFFFSPANLWSIFISQFYEGSLCQQFSRESSQSFQLWSRLADNFVRHNPRPRPRSLAVTITNLIKQLWREASYPVTVSVLRPTKPTDG